MPIYDYNGQLYDIADTDPAVAKAQILKYLAKTSPAPEAKPTASREEAVAAARMAAGQGYGYPLTGNLFKGLGTTIPESFKQVVRSTGLGMLDAYPESINQLPPDVTLEGIGFMSPPEYWARMGITSDAQLKAVKQKAIDEQIAARKAGTEKIAAATPKDLSLLERGVRGGIESLPASTLGLGVALLTRQPSLGLGIMGAQTGAESYGSAREAGKSASEAAVYGGVDAVIEVATEALPTKALTKIFGSASTEGIKKKLVKYALGEMGGEEVATFTQSLNAQAHDLDEELANAKTAGEQARIHGERAALTAIATLVQGGVQGGVASIPAIMRDKAPAAPPAAPSTAAAPPAPSPAAPSTTAAPAAPPVTPPPAPPAAPQIRVERLATPTFTPDEQEKIDAAVAAGVDRAQASADVAAQQKTAPAAPTVAAEPTAPAIEILDSDSDVLKEKKAQYLKRQAEIEEELAKKERGEKFTPLKVVNKRKANEKLATEIAQLQTAAPTQVQVQEAAQRLAQQNQVEVPDVSAGGVEQREIAGTAEPVAGAGERSDAVSVLESDTTEPAAVPAVPSGVDSTVSDVAEPDAGAQPGAAALTDKEKTDKQLEEAASKPSAIRVEGLKPTDYVTPTEDQIYSADDENLGRLLYEAHVDENGDLRKDGVSQDQYDKLSAQLRSIKTLPKNKQIGLRIEVGDAIAKAHKLGEEAESVNPAQITAMTNEGVPPSVAPVRKRGRPKGSKNKPKEGTAKPQQGVAAEVVVNAEQVSKDAPAQTSRELTPAQLQQELSGKTALFAINHLIASSSNPLYRLLGKQLKPIIIALTKAGVVMGPIRYGAVQDGLGLFEISRIDPSKPFTAKNMRLNITLREGAGYSTLMHEMLHFVLVPMRLVGDLQGKMGVTSQLAQLAKQYRDIGRFVIEQFNSGRIPDTESAKLIDTNFPNDPDEVFAWSLSSNAAWNYVNNLRYSTNPLTKAVITAGDAFVAVIRKLLNLPVRYQSALEEMLSVTARMAQLSPQEMAEALEAQYAISEPALRKAIAGPKLMAAPRRRKASATTGLTAEQLDQKALADAKQATKDKEREESLFGRVKRMFSNEALEEFERRKVDNRRAFAQIQNALDMTGTLVLENVVDASGKVVKGFNNIRDRVWSSSTNLSELYKERLSKLFDQVQDELKQISEATGLTVTEVSSMADYYRKMMHLPERRRTLFMLFSPLNNSLRNLRVPKPNIPDLTADEKTFLGVALDGSPQDMTAAEFREFAVKLTYLSRDNLDPYIQAYRSMLMDLTEPGGPNSALTANGSSLGDVMGSKHNIKPGGWPLDMDDQIYTPLENYTAAQEKDAYARFMDATKTPQRDLYLKLFATLDKIQDQKKQLDREANFWSTPVENISKLYGWNNYVPLTGRPAAINKDEQKELDALEAKKKAGQALTPAEAKRDKELLKKLEREPLGRLTGMTEYASNQNKGPLEGVEITNSIGMGGRTSASDNVISAVLTGAVKAAMRLARRDTTQAIVNLINTKSPTGRAFVDAKLVKTLPFHERFTGIEDVLLDDKGNRLPSNQIFLHYTPDGTVQVYKFSRSQEGQRVADALRKDKKDSTANALVDKIAVATGYYARSFTALNTTFLIKDFVRNTLSLTFTATSDNGKRFMLEYGARLAGKIATLGWNHAIRASYYYQKGQYKKLEELAKKYPYRYKNLYDLLVLGKSDLTLLSEFTSLSQSQRILTKIATQDKPFKYWAQGKGEDIRAFLDVGMRAFNLMFQAEAFAIIRNKAMAERGVSNEAASLYAGQYIKDLGNFQKTGELAEQLGGLYAFVRSGSVGAMRFTNSLKPLFIQDVRNYLYGAPQALMEIAQTGVPVYDTQLKEAAKKYSKQKLDTAFAALTSLIGLGIVPFLFAAGGDGDDDEPTDAQGRNTVKSDDLGLWTRGMRIPMSRFDPSASSTDYLTIPYGYGYGGLFAGSGVQMAAWAKGYQSIGDATTNIGLIFADNFLPIQPARFNPFKPIGKYDRAQVATFWMLDTVAPTVLKQPMEYAFGISGLGQQIGAGTSGKYGDPYVTSESTPEVFNDLAPWLSDVSEGAVSIKPERLRFLTNMVVPITDEYVGKGYSLYLTFKGELPFDIRNVPGAAAFAAKRRDPVPGVFYDVKRDVDNKIADMNQDETRADRGDKFAERRLEKFYSAHPEMMEYADGFTGYKKDWNKLNAQLNKVLSEIKDVKGGEYGKLTAGERKQLVRELELDRDYVMEDMVNLYRTAFPQDAKKLLPSGSN